jgi:putative membrane protein
MTRFVLRWAINTAAIYLAIRFVPGISLQSGWVSVIWLALIFGFVNALLRPLLNLLTCPLILLTLGLFTLLINTFLFWLTGQIGQFFGIGITMAGFWPAFLGGLVVTVVSVVLTLILKDELRHHPHPHHA